MRDEDLRDASIQFLITGKFFPSPADLVEAHHEACRTSRPSEPEIKELPRGNMELSPVMQAVFARKDELMAQGMSYWPSMKQAMREAGIEKQEKQQETAQAVQ